MKLIDRQYLVTPFYGARKIIAWLKSQSHQVNRKRVRRLMQVMGLNAIYRRPRTSKPAPGHKIYPYLLSGLRIIRPNQVWAADITYIPMTRGFLYLVAIIDWYSRYVLFWRLSNTLDVGFCVEALERRSRRVGQISSTPTRAPSSPVRPLPGSCSNTESGSVWMGKEAITTTCSSRGCGGQ